jgi:hypothetical protein
MIPSRPGGDVLCPASRAIRAVGFTTANALFRGTLKTIAMQFEGWRESYIAEMFRYREGRDWIVLAGLLIPISVARSRYLLLFAESK